MMKFAPIAFAVAIAALPAAAADTLVYNTVPADGFFYGTGNNYSPANAAVLTTDAGDQLALRIHQTFVAAPASSGNTYSFALGTTPLSFDWSIDNNSASNIGALITLTNVGTGQTFSYNPFGLGNDNANANGSAQNSFRFNWVPGLFTPSVDSTYRVDLGVTGFAGGNRQLSVFAVLGNGAQGAVPEPSTWAMLILGFGLVGGAMRRRRTAVSVSYA